MRILSLEPLVFQFTSFECTTSPPKPDREATLHFCNARRPARETCRPANEIEGGSVPPSIDLLLACPVCDLYESNELTLTPFNQTL
jgi:hypothetical protein